MDLFFRISDPSINDTVRCWKRLDTLVIRLVLHPDYCPNKVSVKCYPKECHGTAIFNCAIFDFGLLG